MQHKIYRSFRKLRKTYNALKKEKKAIRSGSTAEWLLDNFYILQSEYLALSHLGRMTKRHRRPFSNILSFANAFLSERAYRLEEYALFEALDKRQSHSPFSSDELRLLPAALSVCLLIRAGEAAERPYENGDMGNVVKSFFVLRDLDIKAIFDAHSAIDSVLSEDEAFCGMTFSSKELYRRAAARLSAECGKSDFYVAKEAMRLTREKKGARVHVGYFLLGEGENTLRAALSLRKKKEPHDFALFISSVLFFCSLVV